MDKMQGAGIVEGKFQSVLAKVRATLQARGGRGIRGIGRTFRLMDSYDGNKKVDRDEFAVGLREAGVQLTNNELSELFGYFDLDQDGCINFDEFLIGVRGRPNQRRQAMIDKAFLKFDRDGNGFVEASDLRGIYNASMHPKVQKGEMTEDQVFQEFLANFNDRNRDGRIDRSQWADYYAGVSSSIDNDDHFVLLMKMAWKLD